MRRTMGGTMDDEPRTALRRASLILIVLALLAPGCASSPQLPWNQIKQPSIKLPGPSNSYGVGGRATSRLPWPKIKPGSRKLAEPLNNYGVGGRESKLPWPEFKQ